MASVRYLTQKYLTKFFPNYMSEAFHVMYYFSPNTHHKNEFLGYKIDQLPIDMMTYQEIVFNEKPPFIIQTGIDKGGSLLYFATLLDIINADDSALVIGIDLTLSAEAKSLVHPRIRLIEGSSTDPVILSKVKSIIPSPYGLVSLDSDHTQKHVYNELMAYAGFTDINKHLVVEDTNINGHPVYPSFGPGPKEAVDKFLSERHDFVRDNDIWQRNIISFHQGGWLIKRD